MHSWGTLKHKIYEFYMNRSWMDKQKVRANRASYRESGYSQEAPVLYVIRKLKLLKLVYDYTDSQLIVEIMSTAPAYWNQVLDSQRCVDMDDFLNGIKYHEDALMSTYSTGDTSLEKRIRQLEVSMKPPQNFRYRPCQNRGNNNIGPGRDFPSNVHANLVGYHPSLEKTSLAQR